MLIYSIRGIMVTRRWLSAERNNEGRMEGKTGRGMPRQSAWTGWWTADTGFLRKSHNIEKSGPAAHLDLWPEKERHHGRIYGGACESVPVRKSLKMHKDSLNGNPLNPETLKKFVATPLHYIRPTLQHITSLHITLNHNTLEARSVNFSVQSSFSRDWTRISKDLAS